LRKEESYHEPNELAPGGAFTNLSFDIELRVRVVSGKKENKN